MKCDDIAWLVDILGTTSLLESACDGCSVVRWGYGVNPPKDGLFFKRGHWYCYKNGKSSDSYSLDYQIKGTAHFCQTFAAMMYLGETSALRASAYKANIQVAVQFWMDLFTQYKTITKWVLGEIADDYANEVIELEDEFVKGKNLTGDQLLEFLGRVKTNAQSFTGCKEG